MGSKAQFIDDRVTAFDHFPMMSNPTRDIHSNNFGGNQGYLGKSGKISVPGMHSEASPWQIISNKSQSAKKSLGVNYTQGGLNYQYGLNGDVGPYGRREFI